MNIIFFDIESNGLPIDYKASYENVNNWPRIISIAWITASIEGILIGSDHSLIYPDGWIMPTEKFWVDNGFSQEKSVKDGIPIKTALSAFMDAIRFCDILVCHNVSFDHRIVWAELIRAGFEPKKGMTKICTMMKSTKVCNLPNPKGYGSAKWPKLSEMYSFLFGKELENTHDALADVTGCMESFFELVKRGHINIWQEMAIQKQKNEAAAQT